ncbi:helix-turn-helix domain-containing protein [Marinoscillum sp.]|uniref:helix-turn-helix domain-containing protein n=1 Tax=Marinoscillum sp. TaxID=2024838 RepID=UPI003BA8FE0A
MSYSEMSGSFDESRELFRPYGLSCQLWTPSIMNRPDRHNEIELNYCLAGGITYLLKNQRIYIPPGKLILFWGLSPHQIVDYDTQNPYYVCTVPFGQFLKWNLPGSLVERIINGELIIDSAETPVEVDLNLFKNWVKDIDQVDLHQLIDLEIHARLRRLALTNSLDQQGSSVIFDDQIKPVEKIALFIAQKYSKQIKVEDIGTAVGLHPDYANAIFKKAFGRTLSEYLTEERISHAQRQLASTKDSITKIAYESGFNSISRFNASFLRLNGCTPREFRSRNL